MATSLELVPQFPVLEEVLRRRVCSICTNRNIDGSCDVDSRHECILFERLTRITDCISRVCSENIDDYITALRESVCAECFYQHLDGSCEQREAGSCALDRHMVPIIWAIESYTAAAHTAGFPIKA
jgi:hypothetical protein